MELQPTQQHLHNSLQCLTILHHVCHGLCAELAKMIPAAERIAS
jgi:hypothetical protein